MVLSMGEGSVVGDVAVDQVGSIQTARPTSSKTSKLFLGLSINTGINNSVDYDFIHRNG